MFGRAIVGEPVTTRYRVSWPDGATAVVIVTTDDLGLVERIDLSGAGERVASVHACKTAAGVRAEMHALACSGGAALHINFATN